MKEVMVKSSLKEDKDMAEKRYEVPLPQEVPEAFGWKDADVPGRVREALVMDLLRLDRVSEAEAAAMLGLERWDLLETMGRYDVPAVRLSSEEVKREAKATFLDSGQA